MEMNLTFITSLTCITRFLLFQEKINCHLTFLTLLTPHYESYLFLSAVYQATTVIGHSRGLALLSYKISTFYCFSFHVHLSKPPSGLLW